MAEALLVRRLATVGAAVSVRSAGLLRAEDPPPPEVISAMTAYRLDVTAHRSRVVSAADLSAADLVLAMAREHVRHAVVTAPEAWPRAFTLKELVRRGQEIGPRRRGQSLARWLARIHDGRDRSALLGDSPTDDVADPIGGSPQAYMGTVDLLDRLVSQLVGLCWGLSEDGL
jgi:protein-tyrosine phosphatase